MELTRNVTRKRVGDVMVKVVTTIESAIIPYEDIIAAATVVRDEDAPAPWEDCVGWEHETITGSQLDHREGYYNKNDIVSERGHRKLIVVTREQAREWGHYDTGDGCLSKQVAFERGERSRREATDQLVEWYENGYNVYGVEIEFKGENDSCWGIYADDEDGPDVTETKHQCAHETAGKLEKRGYTVTGRPDTSAEYEKSRRERRVWLRAHSFGFKDLESYRKWLKTSPRFPQENHCPPEPVVRRVGRLAHLTQEFAWLFSPVRKFVGKWISAKS